MASPSVLGDALIEEPQSLISDPDRTLDEPMAVLHWKNGDALSGYLLPSQGAWVHWGSPVFLDPLRIHSRALHSIRFPQQESQQISHFRMTSTTGDVFVADLIS